MVRGGIAGAPSDFLMIKNYEPPSSLNKALLRPYFLWWGVALRGYLQISSSWKNYEPPSSLNKALLRPYFLWWGVALRGQRQISLSVKNYEPPSSFNKALLRPYFLWWGVAFRGYLQISMRLGAVQDWRLLGHYTLLFYFLGHNILQFPSFVCFGSCWAVRPARQRFRPARGIMWHKNRFSLNRCLLGHYTFFYFQSCMFQPMTKAQIQRK